MQNALLTGPRNTADAASLSLSNLVALVQSKEADIAVLVQQVAALRHQLDWFKRQLFGPKSERFALTPDPQQMQLGEGLPVPEPPATDALRVVASHTRRAATRELADSGEGVPFFDESRVPVETIVVSTPELESLTPDQYTVIGEKVSYRLAQQPASFVVVKYLRPVIKRLDSQAIVCPPAPLGVIEGSRADVSFCAGMTVDKFVYHTPLYRQHQKLADSGITVSRPWLTQLTQRIIALLEPIYTAQLDSIRTSRVIAMDETPIKAGRDRDQPGKMKQGYFWPVYGEQDEICFPFSTSRAHSNVANTLRLTDTEGVVLLSDGYAAYERFAKTAGVTHAQCWAHTRREFFEAHAAAPDEVRTALEKIRELYLIEEHIRAHKLAGESKRSYRLTHSKPRVELLFEWIDHQFERQGLLPSNPFTKALAYARERRVALSVFLADPDVPIDTNHLERNLRAIPMGRRNWLFCWTELGAKHVGIVQSLLVTCRLQGIDPYTYLVDVLQRVGEHPASRVAELTPRLWKLHFAANPLRSDLHTLRR
ncbi:MAG: IS66 family transposase [Burkholderiales bacterium]